MAQVTRDQLVTLTREAMDAVGSTKWSATEILYLLDSAFDGEWSNILSVAPYYRVAQRAVVTDANGQFAEADLSGGTGDTAQNFYRILTVTDGNYIYDQTRFQDVPLATTAGYPVPYMYDRLYYWFGENIQVLPVSVGAALTVTVNYKPPVPSELSGGSVTVDFPHNAQMIVAWEAAARALSKGGNESGAAADLLGLARGERETMLNDIQRRTINPLRMMPMDSAGDWAGQ
jgi:hypothetical protein